MEIETLVFEILKVLALPHPEKLEYVGKWEPGMVYVFPGVPPSDGFKYGSECLVWIAAKAFHEFHGSLYGGEKWDSIRDLSCVFEMTLLLHSVADYFWILEKEKALSGPLDYVWPVVEFLSKRALSAYSVPIEKPSVSFEKIRAYHRVARVKNPDYEPSM